MRTIDHRHGIDRLATPLAGKAGGQVTKLRERDAASVLAVGDPAQDPGDPEDELIVHAAVDQSWILTQLVHHPIGDLGRNRGAERPLVGGHGLRAQIPDHPHQLTGVRDVGRHPRHPRRGCRHPGNRVARRGVGREGARLRGGAIVPQQGPGGGQLEHLPDPIGLRPRLHPLGDPRVPVRVDRGVDLDAEFLQYREVIVGDPIAARPIGERRPPGPALEELDAQLEQPAKAVAVLAEEIAGQRTQGGVLGTPQVLVVEVELDLVATARDRLDRPLEGLLAVLVLEEHVDEEAAPEPEVLEQIHVQPDPVLLGIAEIAEDQLVDRLRRVRIVLAHDPPLGVDREGEEECRLLSGLDRWRRIPPVSQQDGQRQGPPLGPLVPVAIPSAMNAHDEFVSPLSGRGCVREARAEHRLLEHGPPRSLVGDHEPVHGADALPAKGCGPSAGIGERQPCRGARLLPLGFLGTLAQHLQLGQDLTAVRDGRLERILRFGQGP